MVVLPPLADKTLLKQLPNAKIQDVTKLMSTNIQNIKGMSSVKEMMDMARECERSLTPKQCTVLDAALDAIKVELSGFRDFGKAGYYPGFGESKVP
uniref:Membr_traf_MHD domain-containing protein n=1 Tax=Heterorhabditis bacteriophora TaxID=37862 RepID=A0A1I7XGS8_HETBA